MLSPAFWPQLSNHGFAQQLGLTFGVRASARFYAAGGQRGDAELLLCSFRTRRRPTGILLSKFWGLLLQVGVQCELLKSGLAVWQRRCYWLLESENDIVLVHYLVVDKNRLGGAGEQQPVVQAPETRRSSGGVLALPAHSSSGQGLQVCPFAELWSHAPQGVRQLSVAAH